MLCACVCVCVFVSQWAHGSGRLNVYFHVVNVRCATIIYDHIHDDSNTRRSCVNVFSVYDLVLPGQFPSETDGINDT